MSFVTHKEIEKRSSLEHKLLFFYFIIWKKINSGKGTQ